MSISLTVISLALARSSITKTLLWHHPGNIIEVFVLSEGSCVTGSDSFELDCLNASITEIAVLVARTVFLINTGPKGVIPHVDFVSQITDEHFLGSLHLLNSLLLSIELTFKLFGFESFGEVEVRLFSNTVKFFGIVECCLVLSHKFEITRSYLH